MSTSRDPDTSIETSTARAEEILRFWFGELDGPWDSDPTKNATWFQSTPETDEALRAQFGADVARARAGELDGWTSEPRACLALVILLDQIPRNIFRNTPDAFASDETACGIARRAVERRMDRSLRGIERLFLYVPFEHSEDLADQERCVALVSALADEAPEPLSETYRNFLDYAQGHRSVVERFGRFPHRNAVLGRTSSAEEQAYLDEGGGFGGYGKKSGS